jgi:hypothetical protein
MASEVDSLRDQLMQARRSIQVLEDKVGRREHIISGLQAKLKAELSHDTIIDDDLDNLRSVEEENARLAQENKRLRVQLDEL